MASDKKNKKKKSFIQTLNWKKIVLFTSFIIITVVAIFGISYLTRDRRYDCESYIWQYNVHIDNTDSIRTTDLLEDLKYYRLYIDENDNTFELKYCLNGERKEVVEGGTYVKKGNKITLTYDTIPTHELDKVCEFEIDGDYLIRNQMVNTSDQIYTVVQSFKIN